MRPTGKLHLGNFHGALTNWVELQNQGDFDCYYFVADWHALTSDYSDTSLIQANITDMVIDWLSVGLNPQKSTLFVQSKIKEHAELFLFARELEALSDLEGVQIYGELFDKLPGKNPLKPFG